MVLNTISQPASSTILAQNIAGATDSSLSSGTATHSIVAEGTAATSTVGWKAIADVCFLKGTEIKLSNNTSKLIENIEKDDLLKSYEFEEFDNLNQDAEYLMNWYSKSINGESSSTKVVKLWENKTDKYYVINDKLRITPEHLVFIKKNDNYEWFPAKNVKEGYEIFNSENEFETIKSIEMIEKSESVYNIKLQGIMNYYADTYLVHGSSKCDECENMK